MKFICMDLTNFRQYENAHIDFSCDEEKNVTLIIGDNGSGKTTFVQAFYWCFYGVTSFGDGVLVNSDLFDKAREDDKLQVTVKLIIECVDVRYEIKRSITYRKNYKKEAQRISYTFDIKKLDSNEILQGDKAKDFVQGMLPSELSKYFFFDGETMDVMSETLFSRTRSTDIASVIQSVVGLRSLQQLKKHLKQRDTNRKTVIRTLNEQIDYSGNKELEALSQKIDQIENEIQEDEERCTTITARINELYKEREQINTWLDNNPNVVDLEEEVKRLKAEKNELAEEKDKKIEALAQTMKLGRTYRINDWLYKLVEAEYYELIGKEKKTTNDLNINAATIRKLIEKGKCICGSQLNDNSECLISLQKVLKDIEESGKYRDLQMFMASSSETRTESEDRQVTTDLLMKDFEKTNGRYLDLDAIIRRKMEEMAGRDDEVNEKISRIKEVESIINSEEKNKEDGIRRITGNSFELKKYEKERTIIREKEADNDLYINCLKMAEEIYEQVSAAYDSVEVKVRNQFKKCFQELYDEIYAPGWQFDISEKYEIKPSRLLDQSQGQKYSMVLAFIGTALTLARGRNREINAEDLKYLDDVEQYPLVMDAPLSAFDSTRINNIANTMPQIVKQWIIFIKDTDGFVAQRKMKELIGQQYTIVNYSKTKSVLQKGVS